MQYLSIYNNDTGISIHASREGSDVESQAALILSKISIHASREGSDFPPLMNGIESYIFQSTLPAREATPVLSRWRC